MSARIGIVTCRELPEPDPDQQPLLEALRRAGMQAELLAWDDPQGDPAAFDLCVMRSCWDYHERPEAFVAWCTRVAEVSRLLYPLPVVHWNLHKRYFKTLEAAGLGIIPTAWVEAGGAANLAAIAAAHGWEDVVVKPAISAASANTRRFDRSGFAAEGQAFLAGLCADRDTLVQRTMPGFADPGERALVWIDGELSHAVRKEPRFDDQDEQVSDALPVDQADRELARRALATLDLPAEELLYARIDVIEDDTANGAPLISELELMEPSLFLVQKPEALRRLVAAIERRLRDATAAGRR